MEILSVSLSSLPWPLLTIFLTILLVSLRRLYIHLEKPKQLPPGPPRLPIIGNLHQLGSIPHLSLYKLSQTYGPIMHVQLGQVSNLVISSPELAKEVFKTHDNECCSRPDSYGPRRLSYNLLDIAFSPFGDYWREIRKITVTELLSVKRISSFQHVRDQEVSKLVNALSKESLDPSKKSIQLDEKIYQLTKGFILKVAFGTNYDGEKFREREIQKTIDELADMLDSFWAADFFPSFGWIIDVLSGMHQRLEKCFHEFDKFYETVIQEHLDPSRPKVDNEDIIDILISLSKEDTGHISLSKDHIKAVLMNIIVGAVDTSSVTIVWAMSELARNPRVMKKVQAEIRNIIGNEPKVNDTEVKKLNYLNMVVKETFRLHPPGGLILRESMQHCKIGGYDVVPKTRIIVNAWAIGKDIKTWDNPQDFYPERFEDSEIDFRGNHYGLIPFGAGRRMCPGMTMGSSAVEFTLTNLLHCFDWKLPAGMKPEDINMDEEVGLNIRKKMPLQLVPVKYKWDV